MSKAPVAKKSVVRTAKRAPDQETGTGAPRGTADRPRSLTAQAYERIEELLSLIHI